MSSTDRSPGTSLASVFSLLMAAFAVAAAAYSSASVPTPPIVAALRQPSTAPVSQRRVLDAVNAFLATLDAGQRARAAIDLNAKSRTVWSNLPTGTTLQVGATERNGLKFGDMSPAQEKAALAVVAAALSREGYDKVTAIVDADELLEQRAAPRAPNSRIRFGRKEYYLAILGTPATTSTWMLQFGGHHLAINVTYAGGQHVLAPTHTGTQPASYTLEGKNIRPLGQENDKAFAFINGLPVQQRQQAILGVEVRNLVLGPGADGKMIAPEGIKGSALSAPDRARLLDLIGEWVRIVGDEAAKSKIAEAETQLAETYFAWAGPTTNGSSAYFRIQGPTVFIEYAAQGNPDHIHTIYRDPTNDYAAKATTR
jgi:hypothetical protein